MIFWKFDRLPDIRMNRPNSALPLVLLAFASVLRGADPQMSPDKAARLASTVVLDDTAMKNLKIETAPAEEQSLERTAFALGRIEVLPGNRAVLGSRIAGRAVEVLARPDHEVKAGDPLVVVESRQAGDPPPRITLTAPIGGVVTELAVAPGEPVNPDKPLLAILDLSTVYGVARVPEHLADQVLKGRPLRVRVPGWPGEVWDTKIEHLGAEADPVTGTLEVACHLSNEGRWLRPGMRAEFTLVLASRPDVTVIPRSALQGEPVSRHVFVKALDLKNAFIKTPVVVEEQNDTVVEVVSGLLPGDEVVTRGAYLLAFAGRGGVSLKEAMDAAHGHSHNEDGSEIKAGEADHDHDLDHDHDHGEPASGKLNWFFVGTTVLGFGLFAAALSRRHPRPEAKD